MTTAEPTTNNTIEETTAATVEVLPTAGTETVGTKRAFDEIQPRANLTIHDLEAVVSLTHSIIPFHLLLS